MATMRVRSAALLASAVALTAPAPAAADFVHVVGPGESLSSVAAADGLSVAQLAAANGLPTTAQLDAGTAIQIPPQGGSVTAPAAATGSGDGDADGDDTVATTAAPVNAPAVLGGGGAYVVHAGDTLSAIAARAGLSIAQLAARNGIDPNGVLLSGSVLRLSSGGPTLPVSSETAPAAASQPVGPAAEGSAVNPPYPTPEIVTPSQVGSIAAANGVPSSLADAIAYQESGFNNNEVSTADARGVMQILPGTWDWIQQTLTPGASPLAPASALDNVRGGVLLLHSLLNSTGGNPALAAAGYYQGLPSVQRYGVYPSTQQYVNNVMSLAHRFGGG